MNKMMKILFGIIFIISIVYVPSFSLAETQIQTQEGEINIETIPNNPRPYEEVTIKISSFATDLDRAIIVWEGPSGTVLSGIGKTSYSFTASGPNTTSIFNITIKPVGSMNTIEKRIIVSPSEIELLWESVDGYTPPFYKGKSFSSKEGFIKAVAIPNTNTIKSGSGSISYSWKNNESAVQNASGYNKNSYTFKTDLFDNKNTITVTASSVNDNYSAENSLDIESYSPKIIFYKRSPTEGVLYNKALNSKSSFTEDEMTVVAAPYFLALKGSENNFIYNWSINGDKINTPSKKTELTIRPTSRGGYASIGVVFENINKLYQKVTGTLKLTL